MSQELSLILRDLLTAVLIVLVPIITRVILSALRSIAKNYADDSNRDKVESIMNEITTVVQMAVEATNQTYVDSIKKSELPFTREAQSEAFNKAYNTALSILSDEAKSYISTNFGYIEVYLNTSIEAEVQRQKLKKQSEIQTGIVLEAVTEDLVKEATK